ncbi:hypothetical protein SAMN05421731_101411 [Acinetobacter puyangensis]|uniref:Uncharacterized protein n=1 Tax=Acinetobacter puyangensis TaxID=1096779 RepID=A0A240E674_9GAMM|nr:hypothetical protein SAMN05421731_101411 [Acinetobacter puyangensis]
MDFKLFNQKTLSNRQRHFIILCSVIILILTALIDLLNPKFILFSCLIGILITLFKQQYSKVKSDNTYKKGLEIILCTIPFLLFLNLIFNLPKDTFLVTLLQSITLVILSQYFSARYLFKTVEIS